MDSYPLYLVLVRHGQYQGNREFSSALSAAEHPVTLAGEDQLDQTGKFLRELMAQKLIREGFKISEAVDGTEGIKKIKEEKPALILLDLILPGIDGFEVLAKMKEDPLLASTPVIILSNLGQKEDVERGLKLGAVDYLIKAHFTPGEIITKVKSILK